MIVSLFKDTFCIGVDYSERIDCLLACDLSDEDVQKLVDWYDFEIKKGKVNIYQWEKWQAKQEQILEQQAEQEKIAKEQRKKQILSELWVLSVQLEWAKMVEDTDKIKELEISILSLKDEYKNIW